ncbi:hypothetical protein TVAG_221470 [Trichomonas vaginalis G3]|uniref:Clu domain-containing protein n=1 Tax=Trichomonas vaginalis (strain ATCC PRA-98 / G3) TaxID=412133 RepID=A2FXE5_TRIV3|nr:intracellular distribution of mitochondria [Trichomonas vaginalis G3]EAX90427.1 hypothetical protein TVAG_221470 [Trichomonas vaginalis G3]KAI5503156.1 intracellular distribution of mitochondria [Trichomonas vaginalis G3]|eukprot:XP_001303357.1 hypothetical protein [Trichomonas vaginalis G3]
MTESKPIPTNITIKSEGIDPYKFMIADLNPVILAESIQNDPALCWFTNCSIATKSGVVTTNSNLKIDLENDILNATLIVNNFSELDALNHAQQFARIVFSLTTSRNCSDCRQSVIGWLLQNYSKDYKNLPLPGEISGIYPSRYLTPLTKELIKTFDLAPNQPTIAERLEGIHLKFALTTAEGKEYIINASQTGFYVEKDKIFKSLHLLVISLSRTFRDHYISVSKRWCELFPLERHGFHNFIDGHKIYNNSNETDSDHNILLRLFDQEDGSILGNIDDIIDSLPNDNFHDVYVGKVEQAFIKNTINGIINIKRGLIPPMNDLGSYSYHDLFIAPLYALAPLYENKGGADAAHRTFSHNIDTYPLIKALSNGYKVSKTMIVDYFNERWVVQCLVPGLLYRKAQVVQGYDIEDHSIYRFSDEFDGFFKELAEKIGVAPSSVKSANDRKIYTCSDCSGIIGSDGNKYIADFHVATPRDYNFPDPVKDHGKIIKREAVSQFEEFKTLQKNDEELVKLGGDREKMYRGTGEELNKRKAAILDKIERILFDVNALTVDSNAKEVPQNIIELASFLKTHLIPLFIEDFVQTNGFVSNGTSIVNEMHRRGINARYLGEVAKHVKNTIFEKQKIEKEKTEKGTSSPKSDTENSEETQEIQTNSDEIDLLKASLIIIEAEMIIRSIKYLHRHESTDIQTLITTINRITNTAGTEENVAAIREKIKQICLEKYNYELNDFPASAKNLILSGVLSSFSVKVVPRASVDKLCFDHVVDVEPLIKFSFSKSAVAERMVNIGTSLYTAGDLSSSLNIFQTIAKDSKDIFDKTMATTLFYIALIKMQTKEYQASFDMITKSLIISEHYYDQFDPEIIIRYSILRELASMLGMKTLSYVLAVRVLSLVELFYPFHPSCINASLIASDLAAQIDPKVSQTILQKAIENFDKFCVNKKNLSYLHARMAMIYINSSNVPYALSEIKIANELDPENEKHKQLLVGIEELAQNMPQQSNKNNRK